MGLPTGRLGCLVRTGGGGVKRAPTARADRGGGQVEYKNRKWWVRRSASEGDGPRRRWREGPYATQQEADAACSKATLSYTAATPIGEWLDGWVDKEARRALLGQREDHARRVRTDVNHCSRDTIAGGVAVLIMPASPTIRTAYDTAMTKVKGRRPLFVIPAGGVLSISLCSQSTLAGIAVWPA